VAEVDDRTSVFWSPDGEHIGFLAQRTLWQVEADGGRPVPVCRLPGTEQAIGGTERVRTHPCV